VWAPYVTVFGKAHVAYIPNGKIVGLSKIQELLMLLQEECKYKNDWQIKSKCIQDALDPLGSCCNRSAAHVYANAWYSKQNSVTTTSSFTGAFER
jgi:GTP cyclohydrolase I